MMVGDEEPAARPGVQCNEAPDCAAQGAHHSPSASQGQGVRRTCCAFAVKVWLLVNPSRKLI